MVQSAPSMKAKMDRFCEKLFDHIQVGLIATYRDGTICFMNASYANMFGFDRTRAIGDDICRYCPAAAILEVMRTGVPHKHVSFSYNGLEALVSRYPVTDGDEIIGGFVEVYFRNIGELQVLLSRIDSLEKKASYFERRAQGLPSAEFTFDNIIGDSITMQTLKQQGRKFANNSQPVLITGESGTGKELVAHALHAASPRANEVLVRVNCAAIPAELMESELFGYEEGAFTGARRGGKVGKFELADRGTIFLDEIAEIPLAMQAKLLRVLEQYEIQKIGKKSPVFSNFRLIAATNKDLAQLVLNGHFREDLYHRLSILQLRIPSLVERTEDIPQLAAHLLDKVEGRERHGPLRFDPKVMELFQNYAWPGNIRELKNVLIYALFSLDPGAEVISARNLPPHLTGKNPAPALVRLHAASGDLKKRQTQIVTETIENALGLCLGNKTRAAAHLGISRNELYRKMRKLRIEA